MDALASFIYLNDHLPTWIIKITTLASHTATKRKEFAGEYQKALEYARPKRKKTPSTTSLRTVDRHSVKSLKLDANTSERLLLPRLSEISPLDPANRYLFANARLAKRRQATTFRSGASQPQTFRNQHQVIIYYDSFLQEGLEALVKEVGTARNNLRKGRQARVLERGLRLPSLNSGTHGRRQRVFVPPNNPKSCPPALDQIVPEQTQVHLDDTPPDDDALFSEAAQDLEAAQALCERAAHQFLRDGDCMLELDQIKSYFENVLRVAQVQMDALEQEKKATSQDTVEPERSVKREDRDLATAVAEKLQAGFMPVITATPNEAAEIEVDSDNDSGAEDVLIDISRFRAARVNGMRA